MKSILKLAHLSISPVLVTGLIWLSLPLQIIHAEGKTISNIAVNKPTPIFPPPAAAPKKRALIVGISKYCPEGKTCTHSGPYWWNLNTEAEITELARILQDPNGQFKFDEVKVLKDKDATHENIKNTFKSFLIDKTKPGDIAYFHYSGHGGQVPDDDQHGPNPIVGDEIDGLDETLIPVDYKPGKPNGERDHSNDIRDDEIGELLNQLQDKKPGNVTLTFDSCFSGTIQRGGESIVRGAGWEGPAPTLHEAGTDKKDESASGLLDGDVSKQGNYVLMSATRSDQLANETPHDEKTGKPMGVFTSALTKALRKAGPDTTYRDIFQSVSDEVARLEHNNQNPQLEGQIDQKLMSGTVRTPSPYIQVTLDQDGRNILLKAGKFMGITTGSEYSIYENGQDTKGQPLIKAVIEETGDLTAKLKPLSDPGKNILEKLKTGRAIETKHAFGDVRLKVIGQENLSDTTAAAVLKDADLINPAAKPGDYDVRICRGKCADEIDNSPPGLKENFVTLQRAVGGSVIARVPDDSDQSAKVAELLQNESRWRFFNTLQDGGDKNLNGKVKIRLIPVTIKEKAQYSLSNGRTALLASKADDLGREVATTTGNRIEFKESDTLMMEVANLSDKPLYITVIDVTGSGKVTPLFPHPIIPVGNSSENKFMPAKLDSTGNPVYQRIPCPFVINITPPPGAEAYRVIATTEPADFSPLFTDAARNSIRGGGNMRGMSEAKSPLGQLLMTAMSGQTARGRGGDIFGTESLNNVSLDNSVMTITSIPLEIVKK